MATWVYPFFKISDDIYRPWIPIQIFNPKNNESINAMALLNTGADHCVFPKFAADQTKLDLKGEALDKIVRKCKGWRKQKLLCGSIHFEFIYKVQIGEVLLGRAKI